LADHRYHKQQAQQKKTAALLALNERILSKAFTTTTYREDQELKAQEEELLKDFENISSDEEEKQVLKKYREQRLKEITTANSLKKRFGSLKEISANQYVKAIDNEPPNVCVIVHLYENVSFVFISELWHNYNGNLLTTYQLLILNTVNSTM
jgi:hypothetical protein